MTGETVVDFCLLAAAGAGVVGSLALEAARRVFKAEYPAAWVSYPWVVDSGHPKRPFLRWVAFTYTSLFSTPVALRSDALATRYLRVMRWSVAGFVAAMVALVGELVMR